MPQTQIKWSGMEHWGDAQPIADPQADAIDPTLPTQKTLQKDQKNQADVTYFKTPSI